MVLWTGLPLPMSLTSTRGPSSSVISRVHSLESVNLLLPREGTIWTTFVSTKKYCHWGRIFRSFSAVASSTSLCSFLGDFRSLLAQMSLASSLISSACAPTAASKKTSAREISRPRRLENLVRIIESPNHPCLRRRQCRRPSRHHRLHPC